MIRMKEKVLSLIAFFAMSAACLSAQEAGPHNFELGAGFWVPQNLLMFTFGGNPASAGPAAFFEYRYDVAEHFDTGVQVNYRYSRSRDSYTGDPGPRYEYNDNFFCLRAVADYNICPSKSVKPYVGIYAGAGVKMSACETGGRSSGFYGVAGPRIGIQVLHFRLSLNFDFSTGHEANATGINLGFVF